MNVSGVVEVSDRRRVAREPIAPPYAAASPKQVPVPFAVPATGGVPGRSRGRFLTSDFWPLTSAVKQEPDWCTRSRLASGLRPWPCRRLKPSQDYGIRVRATGRSIRPEHWPRGSFGCPQRQSRGGPLPAGRLRAPGQSTSRQGCRRDAAARTPVFLKIDRNRKGGTSKTISDQEQIVHSTIDAALLVMPAAVSFVSSVPFVVTHR